MALLGMATSRPVLLAKPSSMRTQRASAFFVLTEPSSMERGVSSPEEAVVRSKVRRRSKSLVVAVVSACGLWSSAVMAEDVWVVARATMSGAGSLQPATSQPILGKELTRRDGKKAACEAAQGLKTDDPADSARCFTYTMNSIALCANEGVTLQQ